MNPLVKYNDIDLSEQQEERLRGEIIENTEGILTLTKQNLSAKKAQIVLNLDNRKLDAALRIMKGMESIADFFTDIVIIDRVRENVKTARDMQLLAEAFKTMNGELKTLSRPDSLDNQGSKKELRLGVQFGDTKVAIEMKE